MDDGQLAIVITLSLGFLAVVLAVVALIWQSRKDSRSLGDDVRELRGEMRGDMREMRGDIRDLGNRLGERVSEIELDQARNQAVNEFLRGRLDRQEDIHQAHAD